MSEEIRQISLDSDPTEIAEWFTHLPTSTIWEVMQRMFFVIEFDNGEVCHLFPSSERVAEVNTYWDSTKNFVIPGIKSFTVSVEDNREGDNAEQLGEL